MVVVSGGLRRGGRAILFNKDVPLLDASSF